MRAAITSGCLARDKPGTAATIATRLAEQKISLESIVQRHDPKSSGGGAKGGAVPVILITYATTEDARAQGPCRSGPR